MDPPTEPVAARFGALVTELATRAGYDLTSGSGGRTALAKDIGMSASAVGRMLDGKTLPMPSQYERIARAVNEPVRNLLVQGGVISAEAWPKTDSTDVRSGISQSQLTPEAAADAWNIHDPMIRSMLVSNIHQAIRLQREAHDREHGNGVDGGAVARG